MRVIHERNVNGAHADAVHLLDAEHTRAVSRAGDVLEYPGPVTTVYTKPMECVLWDPVRDCSPWLHLFESMWMLAGRHDVEYLNQVSKHIGQFVDDGSGTQHGAYGYRWRHWFGIDQLDHAVRQLQADPMSRRVVLQMWSPLGDTVSMQGAGGPQSPDVPCNLSVTFSLRTGRLDMVVFCRSNDIVFGCYGANAVHFSFLLQYIAARLAVPVGTYHQISVNWHAYDKVWKAKVSLDSAADWSVRDPYLSHLAVPMGLTDGGDLDNDIRNLTDCGFNPALQPVVVTDFMRLVVAPLRLVWVAWKAGDKALAFALLGDAERYAPLNDWLLACRMWMERRNK